MKKSISLLIGILTFLLVGCVQVTFTEPMPFNRPNKTTFPKSLQGEWFYKGDNDELAEKITISSQFVDMGDENIVINDQNLLRKFNGFYVLNSLVEDKGRYSLTLAKKNGAVLGVYKFDGSDEAKIKIWEEILGTDSVDVINKGGGSLETEEIILKPENNSTFRKLLNEGGVTHLGDYVR